MLKATTSIKEDSLFEGIVHDVMEKRTNNSDDKLEFENNQTDEQKEFLLNLRVKKNDILNEKIYCQILQFPLSEQVLAKKSISAQD